jgi:hypothetical protein
MGVTVVEIAAISVEELSVVITVVDMVAFAVEVL